jgi:hypothetical protein
MKALLVALIILTGAVCASAQKVKVSADANFNLAKYKTYAWDKGVPANNPLIEQNIITSVDQALTAKGLTKVTANPDLLVISMAALNSDLQMYMPRWSNNIGSPTWYGMAVGQQMATISQGMLVVDVADAAPKTASGAVAQVKLFLTDRQETLRRTRRASTRKSKKPWRKCSSSFPVRLKGWQSLCRQSISC